MIRSRTIRNHIWQSLLIAMVGFPLALAYCTVCRSDLTILVKAGTFSATIWVVMWKGNELLSCFLDSKIDWLKNPVKRFSWGLVTIVVYPILAMYLLNQFFGTVWDINVGDTSLAGTLSYGWTAVVITFVISSFFTARAFFLSWRQLAINEEKMQREAAVSKYEALKNQVNPHFLFNSLNVLTSLVRQNPDLATDFIKKLSEVYRYVLEAKDREIVSLEEEIEFVKSYLFLQKIRHEKGLQFNIDIDLNGSTQVAPLAIQMLVENAIKHNVVSKEEPLTIDIGNNQKYITVTNNLQRKDARERGPRVGLKNISARYEFLSEIPVEVEEGNAHFTVKIPLLSTQS